MLATYLYFCTLKKSSGLINQLGDSNQKWWKWQKISKLIKSHLYHKILEIIRFLCGIWWERADTYLIFSFEINCLPENVNVYPKTQVLSRTFLINHCFIILHINSIKQLNEWSCDRPIISFTNGGDYIGFRWYSFADNCFIRIYIFLKFLPYSNPSDKCIKLIMYSFLVQRNRNTKVEF